MARGKGGAATSEGLDLDKLSLLSLKLVVLCVWSLYIVIVIWLAIFRSDRGIDPEIDPALHWTNVHCMCLRPSDIDTVALRPHAFTGVETDSEFCQPVTRATGTLGFDAMYFDCLWQRTRTLLPESDPAHFGSVERTEPPPKITPEEEERRRRRPPPYGWGCPVGYRCPEGTRRPIPCEPGSFQPAAMQMECFLCPEKFYNPFPGQDACITCPEHSVCSEFGMVRPARKDLASEYRLGLKRWREVPPNEREKSGPFPQSKVPTVGTTLPGLVHGWQRLGSIWPPRPPPSSGQQRSVADTIISSGDRSEFAAAAAAAAAEYVDGIG